MKITKSQLKQIITEEMEYMRLVEEVTQDATEKQEELQRGALAVKDAFLRAGPEKVKDIFVEFFESQGFKDPCDFAKKNEAQLRQEFKTMVKAQEAVVQNQEIKERISAWGSMIAMGGALPITGSLVLRLYNGLGNLGQAALEKGSFGLLGGEEVAQTFMNLDADQWFKFGAIMVIMGLLIKIYRYMLSPGIACTLKDFGIGLFKVGREALGFILRFVGNLLVAFSGWIRSLWSRSRGSAEETEETPTDAGPWQPVTEGYKYSTSISLLKEWKLINSAVSDSLNHLQTTGVLG
jgi:hypothetical protein